MPGASRSIVINAPRERVFDVLTDYDSYASFLKEVKSVRSERQGSDVLVHYEVSMMKTIKYTLKMHEERPSKITWTFHEGQVMRSNQGSWTLEEKGPSETEVSYQIDITLSPLVPKSLTDALVSSSLPAMLEAFKKRSESA